MADDRNKTLGDVIREARVALGLSLRDLAKQLGIAPSYQSDIENDRRVPAEDVLRETARLLKLDFDHLMALGGRVGEKAERYLRRHPTAGVLFRRISDSNLSEEALRRLLDEADNLGRKEEESP